MINDNVRKLTITGEDKDHQVVMREELSDDELDLVNGGVSSNEQCNFLNCDKKDLQGYGMEDQGEDCFGYGHMGMCSGYEQQDYLIQLDKEENDEMGGVREDCFAYSSMGMCSGYGQQASLTQDQGIEEDAINQTNNTDNCITYGFMSMCSGYELAGS